MTLLAETEDDGKGGRRPYFKFYFEDFVSGCLKAGLSAEEVGMYVMSLGFIWTDNGQTPADERRLGIRTGWDTRVIRRLKQALITKGKLTEDNGLLRNARMEREIVAFVKVKKAAQDREAAKRERKSNGVQDSHLASTSRPATGLATPLAAGDPEKIFPENSTKTTEIEARRDHIPEPEPEKRRKKEKEGQLALPETPSEEAIQPPAIRAAFDAYNALAKRIGLSEAKLLTEGRRKAIKARLAEYHAEPLIWARALAAIERSSFLRGKNDRKWKADLDFMLQPSSFTKLVEGKYGNGAAHVPDPGANRPPASNAGQEDTIPGETFAQRIQRLSRARIEALNEFDRQRGAGPLIVAEETIPSDDPF